MFDIEVIEGRKLLFSSKFTAKQQKELQEDVITLADSLFPERPSSESPYAHRLRIGMKDLLTPANVVGWNYMAKIDKHVLCLFRQVYIDDSTSTAFSIGVEPETKKQFYIQAKLMYLSS